MMEDIGKPQSVYLGEESSGHRPNSGKNTNRLQSDFKSTDNFVLFVQSN